MNQTELRIKFPHLQIPFGIHTYDGWYWLVRTMLETLDQFYAENTFGNAVVFKEIKQKMGWLEVRYNYGKADPIASQIIHAFERASGSVCVDCCSVSPGGYTCEGWVVVICRECHHRNKKWNRLPWKPFTMSLRLNSLEEILPWIKDSVFKDRLVELVKNNGRLIL
jgi:hypothetical protein